MSDRDRTREQAREDRASRADLDERPSRVQQLQSRLGNARLLQLRAAAIQREGAPDWVRDQLGIGPTQEANFARVQEAHAAAEQAAASVSLPGGGTQLDASVRDHAESHLGMPMGDVRVVQGADAACDAMGAVAFATGSEIYLSSSVDPSSADGQFTMAHELAHVAQQKRGETSGLEGLDGDAGKRESLEQAADATAAAMLR